MFELEELEHKKMSDELQINVKLTDEQELVYNTMADGKSIFITGPAGTGKSMVVKLFTKVYSKKKKIAITSTTGTSALLINGTTLHSYTGIGLGKGSVAAITKLIFTRSYLYKRWNELEILIIDEVSMLTPELFDKLEEIARIVRHNDEPFGGIQLVLSGDFCQLPCIDSDDFCCHAKSWDKCISDTFYFKNIMRQGDKDFQKCLNHIRVGEVPDDVIEILESRVGAKLTNKHGIKPTKLYPKNYAVDYVNGKELDKLAKKDLQFYEYEMETKVYPGVKNRMAVIEKFQKYCTAPEILQLCVGAQVMLLFNLDMPNKLANGSRGVITEFIQDIPVVKFLNGQERVIDYHMWEVEENDQKLMHATQIPLKLAYALSIHKSQGCSLDYAEIDLSEIFAPGQSYVALSRVKNLQGLSIIALDVDKIIAHPKAIDYYKKLEARYKK